MEAMTPNPSLKLSPNGVAHWACGAGALPQFCAAVPARHAAGATLARTLGITKRMLAKARLEEDMLNLLGPRLRAYFPEEAHENPAVWLSQTFGQVLKAIVAGDTAAVSLACDLIEKDPMLPFGKLIKSDLARALKKQVELLVASERAQVLGATVKLLNQEYAPRELEDYCKLAKKLPGPEYLAALSRAAPRNPKAERLLAYLAQSDA
jgi:hypothetical protein